MTMKFKTKRFLFGLLAVVTIATSAIQPVPALAAEGGAEKPPSYETVKEFLDADEVVTAKNLEIEASSSFDIEKDFTNIEISDSKKVKVTFEESHPDFSTGKRFIITHLAAAYANGSSDAFSGTNSTGKSLAMGLYNYCESQSDIPDVAMSFSNANVKAYIDGNGQRTPEVTFKADELQTITFYKAGTKVASLTTIKQPFQVIKAANNGKTDANLLAGAGFSAYVVRETTTPHNYTLVDDFIVTIMKITVAGVGCVGLSLAVLLAQNHEVTAITTTPAKADKLNKFISPFHDDEIERAFREANAGERVLNFKMTVDKEAAYSSAELVIIAGWKYFLWK